MPQSLARVLVHLVFSTKHRAPLLAPEIRTELHPYLSAVLNNDGCTSLRVGGVEDHAHLLFALSRTRTISQVVENLKTSSSKWLKTKGPGLANFHWQNGYGIFSVSQSHADGWSSTYTARRSITARRASSKNSGASSSRRSSPTTSGTFGIEATQAGGLG
jgi:REP element-mobilizing transposase RayT